MNHNKLQFLTPRVILRTTLPALCSLFFIWLFYGHISEFDPVAIWGEVSRYGVKVWAVACLFTWVSFVAVSRYDPIVTKVLGQDVPTMRAASMAWKAIAVSQLVGFGVITGTIVRWIELGRAQSKDPEKNAMQAFKLTIAVTACFLTAWFAVTLLTSATLHLDKPEMLVLGFGICVLIVALGKTNFRFMSTVRKYRREGAAFILLTFVDSIFAALVLYTFLPTEIAPFSAVYLAFLLSYLVGLVSGLPGGVGPFEICMLTLLPAFDPILLAPALVGFRIVYFAVPAIIAVTLLGLQVRTTHPLALSGSTYAKIPARFHNAAPPETDLMCASQLTCFVAANQSEASLVLRTKKTIIQLGDPFGGLPSSSGVLASLRDEARWSKRSLCLYRCSNAMAQRAQQVGMKAYKFSAEAILKPTHFDLNIPARSGLRRKLRKSLKEGVTVNSQTLNIKELSEIDVEWTAAHGQARGFSTGRFSKDLVQHQRLYVAYQDGSAIAFISFSTSDGRWLLDLIRYRTGCPDGSTYALVNRAIEEACFLEVDCVSLGSVPFSPVVQSNGKLGWILGQIYNRNSSLKGLYQFKKYFDPDWQDRYFIANGLVSGFLTSTAVFRAIFSHDGP